MGTRTRRRHGRWGGGRHLPDGQREVALVLATGPGQEAPVHAPALEQGLRFQPAEVPVEPPGGAAGVRRAPGRAPRHPSAQGAALTSPSWGSRRGGECGKEGCSCPARRGLGPSSTSAPSAQPPPRHPSPGPGASPLPGRPGGDRKGRGRPRGEPTRLLLSEQGKAEAEGWRRGAWGRDGFPHACIRH